MAATLSAPVGSASLRNQTLISQRFWGAQADAAEPVGGRGGNAREFDPHGAHIGRTFAVGPASATSVSSGKLPVRRYCSAEDPKEALRATSRARAAVVSR
jgi:hypothetical protein